MFAVRLLPFALASTLCSTLVQAHDWDTSRPDSHAPIGVMGDHLHKTGEFMVSYRLMQMSMSGMLDGSDKVSATDALSSGYRMVPTQMDMDMHMVGMMYAPSDQTTLMMMLPYLENNMDMLMSMTMGDDMMMGDMMAPMTMPMQMESSGVGDIKVGALHSLYEASGTKVHLNLMMSLPTGSIDEKNGAGGILPYRMQLGSGTYDLLPGITYTAQAEALSWGAQASAVIRVGENDRDYTLGNRYKVQGWVQKPVYKQVSLSLRMAYESVDNIDGADTSLNPMMTPLADADLQGGETLTAALGLNATLTGGHRVALEYVAEIDQDLDGPQMALDDTLTLGWQLAF
jgi:hypothetical protein